jgi:hypothetical protein
MHRTTATASKIQLLALRRSTAHDSRPVNRAHSDTSEALRVAKLRYAELATPWPQMPGCAGATKWTGANARRYDGSPSHAAYDQR